MTAPNPLYQEGYSMTDTTDQQAVTVALSKQLEVATDINACFCIGCGQPDEPELHDPARCPAREGGKLDVLTVADALEVYDTSCDEEPDLDGDARALHCAIVATRLASVSSASAADFSLNALEDQPFMTAWSEMEAKGFAYGDEELESVHLGWLMARGHLTASPEPVPATNQAGEVRTEWRCFHCGDAFTDERCARLHFGRDEDSAPACQIKAGAEQGLLGALRDAEYAAADAMRAIADECTDAAKAYYSQMTRHNQALRNAEELGYERGLADARALATQPATSQEGEAKRLVEYLFGDQRNGDGVRVVDLCFTAFMNRDKPNPEDGGQSDWFTDTKPLIDKGIADLKDRLLAALATQPATSQEGEVAAEWAEIRPLLTGLISDVECAIHYNEGVDALSGEAPDEARAGIERMDALVAASPHTSADAPINMLLNCPKCGVQHVDEPTEEWGNPPHRSHLCLACGHIWRPADVPTNGVAAIATRGSADSESLAATPTPPTLSEDLRELERLREEVAFLLARSRQAGKFTFGGKRWTGVSSNALVSIAFGEAEEALPSDSSDLAACYRAVMRLPMHRRTDAVFDHLEAGERHVEAKYEGSIKWAREDAEWPGRASLACAQVPA